MAASYIGYELLEEILVRLPVKHIVRLNSICKRWQSLIKSASFVKFYNRRHRLDRKDRIFLSRCNGNNCVMYSTSSSNHDNNNFDLIPMFDLKWIPQVTFEIWPNVREEDLLNNSYVGFTTLFGPLSNDSGIYLVIDNDCQKLNRISVATSKIALCNLATREYKFTNAFPPKLNSLLFNDIAQKPSLVHYGFGSICNEVGVIIDYKVVVIILSGADHTRFLSFVYSLKRGGWEKIVDVKHGTLYNTINDRVIYGLVNEKGEVQTPCSIGFDIVRCPRLFFNGSWHWLDVLKQSTNEKYKTRVLVFDFANEVFRSIGGPPHDNNLDNSELVRGGLSLLDDHLVAIYIPHVDKCCVRIDVWMMMEYGIEESWTKIYSCTTAFNRRLWSVVGLWYHVDDNTRNLNIHKILLDDSNTKQLVSWDGSCVKEYDFHIQPYDILWNIQGISTYVETLESLDGYCTRV